MQVTIITKVNAQIIHGPDNVPAGTYYVEGISPHIKYHWTVTGSTNVVPILPNVAQGAVDEKKLITWDGIPANQHKIEIIEEPIYPLVAPDPLYPYLPVDPDGTIILDPPAGPGLSDTQMISEAIRTMKVHIEQTGGTGTIKFPDPPPGMVYTYLIDNVLLANGVRLVGAGTTKTILKRIDPGSPSQMLTTEFFNNNANISYSFLATSSMNSKPIEISEMTIDGDLTVPPPVLIPNPDYPNNPNAPQYIYDSNPDAHEHSALILLTVPHAKNYPGGYYIQEILQSYKGYFGAPFDPYGSPPNNAINYAQYASGGSGKLKVFIHHVNFKNSAGDAVLQLENVDLNMHDCIGTDIYRGTYTLTGGATKARLNNISTISTSPATILTKSIDLEGDHLGYGGIRKFRLWIDNSTFDKNVQLDYRCSNVLLTNTQVTNPPISIIGYLGGDLVTNTCTLSFTPVYNGSSIVLSPRHAKFNNTIFNFKGDLILPPLLLQNPPIILPTGCFNGLYFTNHSNPQYFDNSNIGFNNCTFQNNMNVNYTPSYPIYVFQSGYANANCNDPINLKLYFNACNKIGMTPGPEFAALYTGGSCPYMPNPFAYNPGVINNNQIYTGGESEEQMKHHFGIRPIYMLHFSVITPTNLTCNNANNGSISAIAVGVPGIINYTLLPNNITNQTGNFNNLASGIYTITATDVLNFTISTTVTITQPAVLSVSVSNITNVTCNGLCDGSAQANGVGGTIAYTYAITAPGVINANTGAISSLCAGTYTVTVTDANLCTATTSFTVTQPLVLSLGASNITNVTCSGLCNGTAQATGVGGTPAYTYAITAPGIINANTGAITGLCAGSYTVTATDANLCTATTTFTITEPNVLSVSVSNITNVTCNPLCNGTAQATGVGGTPAYTYAITAPGIINANNGAITGLCAGSYTVTITDANSCTATTTLSVTQPPALIWTAINFTNITCSSPLANDGSITVAASGGVGAITYILNYPGGPLVNPLGIFDPLVAHSYTVTASDANGCTISTIIELVAPNTGNFCCNTTLVNTGNIILAKAPTASNLLSLYGNGTNTISNKTFYIDDILIINEDITFNACTLWFTQTGQIQVQVPYTLDVNTSTLQAACDWWEGIVANDPQQKVVIENGSFIKQAVSGLYASNGALIEISNSHFVDNIHYGIQLENIAGNYLGFIKGTTFSHLNAVPASFLPPYLKIGVGLTNISEMTIGELSTNSISNTFSNLNTGIYIKYAQPTGSNAISIYNCSFSDISHIGLSDYQKLTGCYSSQIGAAIYCNAGGTQSLVSNLDIRNDVGIMANSYLNCDKGIVAHGSGVSAKNLRMDNCLFGIMCNNASSRHYVMTDNIIDHTYMGIELTGQQRSASIQGNTIGCTKTIFRPSELVNGMYTMPIFYVPIGIKYQLNGMAPLQYYAHTISANHIYINRIGGIGVYNGNADNRLIEEDNEVHFTTTNMVAADNYSVRSLIGYWNENTFGSNFNRNDAFGSSNPAVWQARNSWGMYMNQSKNCKISCNRLKFTRYGFYIWGNCSTALENITLNKCNANEFPWFFLDNGSASPGTFGDVGGITDNGNEFLSTTNLVDWRGNAGINNGLFKVYRNSTAINFGDQISTTNNLLDFGESGPSGVEYQVQSPQIAGYNDICVDNDPDPVYINGEPTIDSSEYIYSMAVVQDSVEYLNYPTVGSWIDKYRLYLELDEDSLLRNSSPELLYFYNTTTSQTIGDIRLAIEKIALLYDSTTNAANDSLRYANAMAANTLISSANQWEMNEKLVNDVLLFMWNHSLDSLPLQSKEEIQSLASSCPFVEGTAVYRARPIHSYWEPNAVFDDRFLCIQGMNKNQDNSHIDIDSLIESEVISTSSTQQSAILNQANISTSKVKKLIDESSIKIYPNPTNAYIIIEYQSTVDGTIRLFNSLGEMVLNTTLSKENTKSQLMLNDIANGIYHYEIEFASIKKTRGKLTILK